MWSHQTMLLFLSESSSPVQSLATNIFSHLNSDIIIFQLKSRYCHVFVITLGIRWKSWRRLLGLHAVLTPPYPHNAMNCASLPEPCPKHSILGFPSIFSSTGPWSSGLGYVYLPELDHSPQEAPQEASPQEAQGFGRWNVLSTEHLVTPNDDEFPGQIALQ